ncbi:hypothetical protein AEU26_20215 [Salmonella enterica subsp. enterica serovar Kentucky]|nr:ribose operon transcriptional repressor RbsR [Salmonella enterica]KNI90021.1 hypothetical protein AEU26_20215 [Salmonella enterica subsp. enterica serovar Kentucky]
MTTQAVSGRRYFTKAWLLEQKSLIALLVLIAIVSTLSPNFFTVNNLFNILQQTSVNAIMAVGMTLVILTSGIDLSVGSLLALTGAVAASIVGVEVNALVAVAAALALGAAIGAVTGVIVAKGRVQAFIATLVMMLLLRGVTMVYTDGSPVNTGFTDNADLFGWFGIGRPLGVPTPVWIMAIVFIAAWYMLITASTNPFYSELVRGVERSCFERGYSLVLCNTEGDEQRMNRNLETLMQKRVDGLLLLCTETHQPSREIMERYPSIPTVMMDWSPFDGEGDSDLIQDNSLLGGDLATQHLIDKGFTRIACITGPLDKTPARLRLEGYRAAMKRAGLAIPQGYEITGDFEFGGGFDAMQALLAHQQRPQAVFTGNDAMAVGAYQALYQAGLRIPQDMAVIGYDDIELARYMTPPLTTIHQPKDELGELAIDVLIHRMAQPALQQQRLQLTPVLTVRGSV